MTRMLALLLVAVLGLVAGLTSAQAEVVTNEIQTISFFPYVACANRGAGEYVVGTVELHVLITSSVNDNTVSGMYHYQPAGGSMVGSVTGDAYRPTGVTRETFRGSMRNGQYQDTFVNNFRIIGPGPGNNYLVHETFHVTFNANGDVAVSHDLFTVDCK